MASALHYQGVSRGQRSLGVCDDRLLARNWLIGDDTCVGGLGTAGWQGG
jgi:hypothetical protein